MSEETNLAVRPSSEVFALPEAEDLRHQLKKIKEFQEIVHATLIEGQDYGVIPGTDKPALLKPGAEKIAKILGLSEHYELVDSTEDWTKPFFNFHYKCKLIHMGSGVQVSECEGSCNSMESKYRYRNSQRICPNCGKETIIPGKKEWGGGFICWKKKGGCEAKFEDNDIRITGQVVGKVENDDIFSLVNTLQKMGLKRSLVGATLSAGRLSNVFTQDIEDMPGFGEVEKPEDKKAPVAKVEKPKTKVEKPAEKQPSAGPATGTGDIPPFDKPAAEAEGSDVWIVTKIAMLGIKDAAILETFTKRYNVPIEQLNTVSMGDNLKFLTPENKADLVKLLKAKEKQQASL